MDVVDCGTSISDPDAVVAAVRAARASVLLTGVGEGEVCAEITCAGQPVSSQSVIGAGRADMVVHAAHVVLLMAACQFVPMDVF